MSAFDYFMIFVTIIIALAIEAVAKNIDTLIAAKRRVKWHSDMFMVAIPFGAIFLQILRSARSCPPARKPLTYACQPEAGRACFAHPVSLTRIIQKMRRPSGNSIGARNSGGI
jgi:hypothetical protein